MQLQQHSCPAIAIADTAIAAMAMAAVAAVYAIVVIDLAIAAHAGVIIATAINYLSD